MRFVTRKNAAVDRIACPWLIRRFLDKEAEFLYVDPQEVARVAREKDAVPFDVERHSVLFPGHTSDLLRVDVQELGLLVEESPDQPRARDPVDGGVLPGHKSHLWIRSEERRVGKEGTVRMTA